MLPRSPFYAPLARDPFESWPVMTKARWMADFDRINTRGLRLADALAAAEAAERSRDFAPTLGGVAVGLSTGTSGRRGVFLVSPAERRRWAGLMLAKLLPAPLLKPRRVAFFLRADSRLYSDVQASGRIAFRFFDLLTPLEAHAEALAAFDPDVLIAPPSVLRVLARVQETGRIALRLSRLISVAEVLHEDDRVAAETAFGLRLDEVYQATEGVLALTCEAGALHLNEAWVHVEPRWLDRTSRRFTPVITDLTRATQPVIRYALDDVLIAAAQPCPCGRASLTLEAVEGRADDVCTFLAADNSPVRVFPDFLARAVLESGPMIEDFRIFQPHPGRLLVTLLAPLGSAYPGALVQTYLSRLAERLGAEPPLVEFAPWTATDNLKRRRVVVNAGVQIQ